jgi:hypothetical protein
MYERSYFHSLKCSCTCCTCITLCTYYTKCLMQQPFESQIVPLHFQSLWCTQQPHHHHHHHQQQHQQDVTSQLYHPWWLWIMDSPSFFPWQTNHLTFNVLTPKLWRYSGVEIPPPSYTITGQDHVRCKIIPLWLWVLMIVGIAVLESLLLVDG